jgi:hypothetical protein
MTGEAAARAARQRHLETKSESRIENEIRSKVQK